MRGSRPDIVVVGGGIAGLSVAWHLARHGVKRIVLLERENLTATHSSARNAALWIPTDEDSTTGPLALRSAELLDELTAGRWLEVTGALITASRQDLLESSERGARMNRMEPTWLDRAEAIALAPALEGGSVERAVHVGGAGVLDIHRMTDELARAARAEGAEVRTGVEVTGLLADAGRMVAAQLHDGTRIEAGAFVIASGAWAASLGASCGAGLPLVPLRRHLVQLVVPAARAGLLVWNEDQEVYFRPESGGVLASPCDEEPFPPCLPPPDRDAIEVLARKLDDVAPGLAGAGIGKSWACLRTFAPDRELVIGADPRVQGLYWMAGFGGRGMTVAVGAGELAAQVLLGQGHPLAETVSPARLLTDNDDAR